MDITRPVLLLDKKKCLNNMKKMVRKAEQKDLIFRPHFKTHQSRDISLWFKDLDVSRITVSSVAMAQYFAEAGWNDITIAFPVNLRELNEINQLAKTISLNILISHPGSENELEKKITTPIGVFLEIDTGYHRSGMKIRDIEIIEKMILKLTAMELIDFKGFLTHAGHNYQAATVGQILKNHNRSCEILRNLKSKFSRQYPALILSIGDTPGCSLANDFSAIDEIRLGNFVFYDVMQLALGSCSIKDIALALACPVVSINKTDKKIVIYGGAIHLSKESIRYRNQEIFGLVVKLGEMGWQTPYEDTYVTSLSQEHGTISASNKLLNEIRNGDLLGILPVHSCLTANLMGSYIDLQGNHVDHFKT